MAESFQWLKKKKIGQVQKRYNPFRKYISVKIYFRDEELIKTIYKEEKLKDLVIRGPFYENGLSIFPEEWRNNKSNCRTLGRKINEESKKYE